MPGKTIGTKLNPTPVTVWHAHVVIQKIAGKHEVQFRLENGDAIAIRLVHEQVNRVLYELDKRLYEVKKG